MPPLERAATPVEPRPPAAISRRAAALRPPSGNGSTLIELLLAAVMLGIALLAVAPLFVRAVLDVRVGAVRSTAAAHASAALEAWSPIAEGPASREFYSRADGRWIEGSPPDPEAALWIRTAASARYSLSALSDVRLERGEAGGPVTGVGLVGLRVSLSRSPGERAIVRLERFDWISE